MPSLQQFRIIMTSLFTVTQSQHCATLCYSHHPMPEAKLKMSAEVPELI